MPSDRIQFAEQFCVAQGRGLIRADLDLVLTGARSLDKLIGDAAVTACREIDAEPRDRIRTYPVGGEPERYFGMVLQPLDNRWQDVRTFIVQEVDAVIGVLGGKGRRISSRRQYSPVSLCFP